jgi:hypothetical protein
LARFEFESRAVLFCFSFTFVLFGESHLLVSWCVGGRCGMSCNDEDHGTSRRPGAEGQDGCTGRVLSGRCGLHRAHRDEERRFLG